MVISLERTCLLFFFLCCILWTGTAPIPAQCTPPSPTVFNLESHGLHQIDLTGSGVMLRIEIEAGHKIRLSLDEHQIYQRTGETIATFYQMFVHDFNGDGQRDIVIAEVHREHGGNKVHYLLYTLSGGGLALRDRLVFELGEATLRHSLIRGSKLVPGQEGQLIGISRLKNTPLPFINDFWVISHNNDGWLINHRENSATTLISLNVDGGSLVERHCYMKENETLPRGIHTRVLKWHEHAFTLQSEAYRDGYFVEEPDIDALIERVAMEQGIPVEILRALAMQESTGKQFHYGEYLVSSDGGIGVMQVTPSGGRVRIEHLGITYEGADIERLHWDTYFNLTVGAQILYDKWLGAFGRQAWLPRVADIHPAKLESWYFALWAYNGYSLQNFPSSDWGLVYQERVIDKLPSFNRQSFTHTELVAWIGGRSLPPGGYAHQLTASQTNGTLPRYSAGTEVEVALPLGRLRSEPALEGNRLGVLGTGSRLQLIASSGHQGEWWQVEVLEDTLQLLCEKRGFVHGAYLETTPDLTTGTSTTRLNLRSSPEQPLTNLITELGQGTALQVCSGPYFNSAEGHQWYKVMVQETGQEGYIIQSALRLPGDPLAVQLTHSKLPVETVSDRVLLHGKTRAGIIALASLNTGVTIETISDLDGSFDLEIPLAPGLNHIELSLFDPKGQRSVGPWELVTLRVMPQHVKTVIDSQSYMVKGSVKQFDSHTSFRLATPPGTTVMALRLFEELGALLHYERHEGVGTVTLQYEETIAVLREGSRILSITDTRGSRQVQMNAPVVNTGGRTYLPTRAVAEYLGFNVVWSPEDDSITLERK